MLLKLAEDPDLAMEVLRRIVDYQLALVPKFRRLGAHMVTIIDEIAGTAGLMFSPELFRRGSPGCTASCWPGSASRACTPRCCWTVTSRTSCPT